MSTKLVIQKYFLGYVVICEKFYHPKMFPIPPHFYRMYFAQSCPVFTYIIDCATGEAFHIFILRIKPFTLGIFQSFSRKSHDLKSFLTKP